MGRYSKHRGTLAKPRSFARQKALKTDTGTDYRGSFRGGDMHAWLLSSVSRVDLSKDTLSLQLPLINCPL